MKIICISGKAQHGKDTTANFMRDVLSKQGYKVLVAHYADLLKYICRTFFNWDGEKDDIGRSLLQRVGTDVIRKEDPNYWVDFISGLLSLFPNEWDYVIIPDCRFPNEIDKLKSTGINTLHVRVVRPLFQSPLTVEQQKHISEIAMDEYPYDYIVNNGGTLDDLNNAVKNMVNTWEI